MDQGFSIKVKPRFGDIGIKWTKELSDPLHLITFITDHMEEWQKVDSPSIWIKLRGKDLDHINTFLNFGFTMHRLKENNVIVLNKWIRTYSNTLPLGPYGYFGVGALCINSEGHALCVRENFKQGPGPWKLPGGLFDPHKDGKLSDTAIRECFEETGIKAKFDHVVSQRFLLKSGLFGHPDLYTICRLTPVSEEIKFDPVEIFDCKWVDLSELSNNPYPLLRYTIEAEKVGEEGVKEYLENYRGEHFIYMRNIPGKELN